MVSSEHWFKRKEGKISDLITWKSKISAIFVQVSILMPIIVWNSLKSIHCYRAVGVDENIKYVPIESVGMRDADSYFL